MASMKGYVPLRRGLIEHIPSMCGSDIKCYVSLLILADPWKGTLRITTRDLADAVGSGSNRVSESLRRLEDAGYIKVQRAANQFQTTEIQVTKWGKSAAYEKGEANGQQTGSKRAAHSL